MDTCNKLSRGDVITLLKYFAEKDVAKRGKIALPDVVFEEAVYLEDVCKGAVELIEDLTAKLDAAKNRVLTLKEAESHECEMWLERNGNTNIVAADVCIGGLWGDGRCVCRAYTIGRRQAWRFFEDEYGGKWRCWAHRPTDEERAAVPWEVEE